MKFNKPIILIFFMVAIFAVSLGLLASKNHKIQIMLGMLAGKVTVGPICPVERIGQPCPVPPEAYTSRGIIIYKTDGTTVVAQTKFDATGHYQLALAPGEYVVALDKSGFGSSTKDLPAHVSIKSGETTKLTINIDTGIR